jgi:hypothetical protein
MRPGSAACLVSRSGVRWRRQIADAGHLSAVLVTQRGIDGANAGGPCWRADERVPSRVVARSAASTRSASTRSARPDRPAWRRTAVPSYHRARRTRQHRAGQQPSAQRMGLGLPRSTAGRRDCRPHHVSTCTSSRPAPGSYRLGTSKTTAPQTRKVIDYSSPTGRGRRLVRRTYPHRHVCAGRDRSSDGYSGDTGTAASSSGA